MDTVKVCRRGSDFTNPLRKQTKGLQFELNRFLVANLICEQCRFVKLKLPLPPTESFETMYKALENSILFLTAILNGR